MTEGASLLLELYRRHMYACRSGKTKERERLFNLIAEFEWAFPENKKEVYLMYPQDDTT